MVILFVEQISFARPRKKRGNWSFEGEEVVYLGWMVEDGVKREAERVIMWRANDCLPERVKRTVDNVSILLNLYLILLASLEVGKALVTSLVRASFGDTEVIRTHSFHRHSSFPAPQLVTSFQLPARGPSSQALLRPRKGTQASRARRCAWSPTWPIWPLWLPLLYHKGPFLSTAPLFVEQIRAF